MPISEASIEAVREDNHAGGGHGEQDFGEFAAGRNLSRACNQEQDPAGTCPCPDACFAVDEAAQQDPEETQQARGDG